MPSQELKKHTTSQPKPESKQSIFYVDEDIKKIKEQQKKRCDYLNYIHRIYYPF